MVSRLECYVIELSVVCTNNAFSRGYGNERKYTHPNDIINETWLNSIVLRNGLQTSLYVLNNNWIWIFYARPTWLLILYPDFMDYIRTENKKFQQTCTNPSALLSLLFVFVDCVDIASFIQWITQFYVLLKKILSVP